MDAPQQNSEARRRAEAGQYAREIEHLTTSLRNVIEVIVAGGEATISLAPIGDAIQGRLRILLGIEDSTEVTP
jgi:hypothetical protein